jgi:hypothetical protein
MDASAQRGASLPGAERHLALLRDVARAFALHQGPRSSVRTRAALAPSARPESCAEPLHLLVDAAGDVFGAEVCLWHYTGAHVPSAVAWLRTCARVRQVPSGALPRWLQVFWRDAAVYPNAAADTRAAVLPHAAPAFYTLEWLPLAPWQGIDALAAWE